MPERETTFEMYQYLEKSFVIPDSRTQVNKSGKEWQTVEEDKNCSIQFGLVDFFI